MNNAPPQKENERRDQIAQSEMDKFKKWQTRRIL